MAENLPHHTPASAAMGSADWEGDLPARLKQHFPALRALSYLDQHWVECAPTELIPLLAHLRDAEEFDMLTDLTAVDYPNQPERFEIVYILYSFPRNERIRVKIRVAGNVEVPSAIPVFAGANWLERELFDMFGIRFADHPNLKRILMPEDWNGHPLLKDQSIIAMDNDWVQQHLGIESGQS